MVVKVAFLTGFRSLLFTKNKEIHYIGGSDVLPAPLEAEEEAKVVSWLGTVKEQEAKKVLIEHNLRLVV